MKRFAMDKLKNWKEKTNRKPMIIMGAREVGKHHYFAEHDLIEALCIKREKLETVANRLRLPQSSLYYKRHTLIEKLMRIYNKGNLDEIISS